MARGHLVWGSVLKFRAGLRYAGLVSDWLHTSVNCFFPAALFPMYRAPGCSLFALPRPSTRRTCQLNVVYMGKSHPEFIGESSLVGVRVGRVRWQDAQDLAHRARRRKVSGPYEAPVRRRGDTVQSCNSCKTTSYRHTSSKQADGHSGGGCHCAPGV